MHKKRVGFLIAASMVAALIAVGCASAPSAQPTTQTPKAVALEKVKVTQSTASLSFIVTFAARYNGFFSDEGLDVDFIITGSGGPDMAALVSGDVQFNVGAGGKVIQTVAGTGGKIVAIHNALSSIDIPVVMTTDKAKALGITPDSPMKAKLAALKGLTLGGSRPGAISYAVMAHYVEKAGLIPGKDVELVGLGGVDQLLAALKEKKADAVVLASPATETAIRNGWGVIIFDPAQDPDFQPEFFYEVTSTRKEFIQQKPETVRKFVRALVRGNKWVLDTPAEEVAKALALYFPMEDKQILVDVVRNKQKGISRTGEISKVGFEKAVQLELKLGSIKEPVKFEDAVDNQFIPKP